MKTLAINETIKRTDSGFQVTSDVFCLPQMIVNVCLIDTSKGNDRRWVLIDTGLTNSADNIINSATELFESNSSPSAIILTHGHFDHIGSIKELYNHWNIPIYAHELELPYLTGQRDYPSPDPSVGGGLMSRISFVYPNEGIDLGDLIHPLPSDGSIPFMPDWRWIHTPGHTEGHISLFRDKDKLLISGDAFITVNQESAIDVLTQDKEVNGPPAYFTTDWNAAWNSVKVLQALNPKIVVSSHGQPIEGDKLSKELERLARDFDKLAIPDEGKYVPLEYK